VNGCIATVEPAMIGMGLCIIAAFTPSLLDWTRSEDDCLSNAGVLRPTHLHLKLSGHHALQDTFAVS
jgi:hypothetical protein